MTTFKIQKEAPKKNEAQQKIAIKGTSFTFDHIICDVEYVRRINGTKIECSSHLFEDAAQLEAENELTVSDVPQLTLVILKKETGTLIVSEAMRLKISLPQVPFEVSDTFVRECMKLAYNELKFVTTDI